MARTLVNENVSNGAHKHCLESDLEWEGIGIYRSDVFLFFGRSTGRARSSSAMSPAGYSLVRSPAVTSASPTICDREPFSTPGQRKNVILHERLLRIATSRAVTAVVKTGGNAVVLFRC